MKIDTFIVRVIAMLLGGLTLAVITHYTGVAFLAGFVGSMTINNLFSQRIN
jgi:hypothetical protein